MKTRHSTEGVNKLIHYSSLILLQFHNNAHLFSSQHFIISHLNCSYTLHFTPE
ncbi:hypothetical protein E2C01_027580 [Portunus trituberculatus]|uniref:Uncharacterized protein n=1 Tax=Portunus trituberculatus TaxID=210409 RepID=A0A5B7ELX6_PORTR|nr:hypothetical protein [Portunus trituberculatus]